MCIFIFIVKRPNYHAGSHKLSKCEICWNMNYWKCINLRIHVVECYVPCQVQLFQTVNALLINDKFTLNEAIFGQLFKCKAIKTLLMSFIITHIIIHPHSVNPPLKIVLPSTPRVLQKNLSTHIIIYIVLSSCSAGMHVSIPIYHYAAQDWVMDGLSTYYEKSAPEQLSIHWSCVSCQGKLVA